MSEVKWIKIVTDIFDDEKVLLIESMPDADSLIVIWFKLLCFAGKINNSGVLMLNEKIAYTDEMLSTIFRRQVNTVRLALKTFHEFGMIEIVNNVITIPNWEKHQKTDQLETKKSYMREYMRIKREKQKLLTECKTNSKTNCKANVSNLDIYKEDIYKQDKQEKEKTALEITIEDFKTFRKKIKSPMTDRAVELLKSNLEKLASDDEIKIKILEQSILQGWKGIFPLKEPDQSRSTAKKKGCDISAVLDQMEKDGEVHFDE